MTLPTIAHPPETLEGWYALHQIFRFNKQKPDATRFARLVRSSATVLGSAPNVRKKGAKSAPAHLGWSCFVRLIGSTSDLMVIHFRESLDTIGSAQDAF